MSYGGGGTAATDASLAPPLAASTSSSTSTSAPTPSHAPVMTSNGSGAPPPPPPSDNPLFSSDEARFMTDSFASAFSFDPFQYGAPGFKVPAVLPPGLIHSLTAPNNSMANSFRSGNGAGPSMPPWEASPSSGARPQQSRSRQQSWAPGQAPPYAMPQHQQQASWDGRQQHPPTDASFSDFVRRSSTSVVPQHQQPQHHSSSAWAWGQPSPSTSAAQQLEPSTSQARLAGGAYGKSREWQMQQLQALRAERERYMESLPNEASSSSSSAQPPGAFASQNPAAGLSSLGLSFPSSHDFPAASPPDGSAAPGHMLDAWAAPDGDSEMADQAHTHAQSQQGSGSRASKPRSRPSAAATNNDGTPPKRPVDSTKRAADSDAAPGSSDLTRSDSNSYRPWPKAPSPNEPSGSYPPIKLNLSRVDRKALGSDSRVTEAFFGRDEAEERKLFQPHLVDLKERRREERAKKAEMLEEKRRKALQRRGIDPNDNDSGEADGGKASSPDGPSGRKAPHVLLTEAEKKANHIASEQKRRANIRKGYEMLCAGVPALREALEKEGGGAGGGEDGDTSYDVGGERIDGRAGPRSEAVVLGKSVEHLRQLLEEHRDLCSRRDHARAKLARNKLGVDVVVAPGSEDAGEASAASSTAPTTAKKGKAAGGAGKGKGAAAAKGDKKGTEAAAAECKAAGTKAAGKAASKASKSSTGSGEDGVKKEQTDDGAEVEVDGMQED